MVPTASLVRVTIVVRRNTWKTGLKKVFRSLTSQRDRLRRINMLLFGERNVLPVRCWSVMKLCHGGGGGGGGDGGGGGGSSVETSADVAR